MRNFLTDKEYQQTLGITGAKLNEKSFTFELTTESLEKALLLHSELSTLFQKNGLDNYPITINKNIVQVSCKNQEGVKSVSSRINAHAEIELNLITIPKIEIQPSDLLTTEEKEAIGVSNVKFEEKLKCIIFELKIDQQPNSNVKSLSGEYTDQGQTFVQTFINPILKKHTLQIIKSVDIATPIVTIDFDHKEHFKTFKEEVVKAARAKTKQVSHSIAADPSHAITLEESIDIPFLQQHLKSLNLRSASYNKNKGSFTFVCSSNKVDKCEKKLLEIKALLDKNSISLKPFDEISDDEISLMIWTLQDHVQFDNAKNIIELYADQQKEPIKIGDKRNLKTETRIESIFLDHYLFEATGVSKAIFDFDKSQLEFERNDEKKYNEFISQMTKIKTSILEKEKLPAYDIIIQNDGHKCIVSLNKKTLRAMVTALINYAYDQTEPHIRDSRPLFVAATKKPRAENFLSAEQMQSWNITSATYSKSESIISLKFKNAVDRKYFWEQINLAITLENQKDLESLLSKGQLAQHKNTLTVDYQKSSTIEQDATLLTGWLIRFANVKIVGKYIKPMIPILGKYFEITDIKANFDTNNANHIGFEFTFNNHDQLSKFIAVMESLKVNPVYSQTDIVGEDNLYICRFESTKELIELLQNLQKHVTTKTSEIQKPDVEVPLSDEQKKNLRLESMTWEQSKSHLKIVLANSTTVLEAFKKVYKNEILPIYGSAFGGVAQNDQNKHIIIFTKVDNETKFELLKDALLVMNIGKYINITNNQSHYIAAPIPQRPASSSLIANILKTKDPITFKQAQKTLIETSFVDQVVAKPAPFAIEQFCKIEENFVNSKLVIIFKTPEDRNKFKHIAEEGGLKDYIKIKLLDLNFPADSTTKLIITANSITKLEEFKSKVENYKVEEKSLQPSLP